MGCKGYKAFSGGSSGGVAWRVALCAVSLLMLAGAIFALLKTFEVRKADDHRRAEVISDFGLQEAFRKLGESRDWSEGFKNEPYDEEGGVFSVAVTREERGGALYVKIVSTGVSGTIIRTQERELRLDAAGGGSPEGDTASNEGGAPGGVAGE
jgi:hypothetical protein